MSFIKIDAREKGSIKLINTRKDRAKEYYTSKGHEVEITKLDYGDYLFDDQVVFELKTVEDFMSSVSNGSVFEEVANQTMNYKYSYLIIVGSLPKYINASYYVFNKKHSKKSWAILQHNKYDGGCRRIMTMCPVITVGTEQRAFEEMLLQAKKCLNEKCYGGTKRPIKNSNVLIHVLTGVGGVSIKRAEAIIKTLEINNLYDLMGCSVEDFKRVKQIGKKTASNIYDFIHYGDDNNV